MATMKDELKDAIQKIGDIHVQSAVTAEQVKGIKLSNEGFRMDINNLYDKTNANRESIVAIESSSSDVKGCINLKITSRTLKFVGGIVSALAVLGGLLGGLT